MNLGAQLAREVASKTNDVAGDGTTTATVLAQAIVREGMRMVAAGANPMALKRGLEMAVDKVKDEIRKISHARCRQGADRPGGEHLRPRPGDRRHHRRRHGEGRQGRRHHRRRVEGHPHGDRVRRGHAARPRLLLALLRDQRRPHGGRAGRPLHPDHRQEDLLRAGPAARAGARAAGDQEHRDHRRRRGRRGAGHARREQAARQHQRPRREGAFLRRPPQGDPRGHRDPHRRHVHHRGHGPEAGERPGDRPRPRPPRRGDARKRPSSSRATAPTRRSRPASSRSRPSPRTPPPSSTARSCRSGWPSWPAAWR